MATDNVGKETNMYNMKAVRAVEVNRCLWSVHVYQGPRNRTLVFQKYQCCPSEPRASFSTGKAAGRVPSLTGPPRHLFLAGFIQMTSDLKLRVPD